jgi:sarcosine oxidase subunit gamma
MTTALSRSPLTGLLPSASIVGGLDFSDLTLAPRAGVKGRNARAWLAERGYEPLPAPNFAMRGASGVLVAMLGESEALLLDRLGTARLWGFESGAAMAPGVYPVPRAEGTFWITVSGRKAPAMFASVCGVDLRPRAFPDLRVAQTMMAKATAIIIRDDGVGESAFHVLGDISFGPYLVGQLLLAAESA